MQAFKVSGNSHRSRCRGHLQLWLWPQAAGYSQHITVPQHSAAAAQRQPPHIYGQLQASCWLNAKVVLNLRGAGNLIYTSTVILITTIAVTH